MLAKRTFLICVALISITLGLYWRATSFGFIRFDDTDYVTSNRNVQAGLSWENVKWAFQTDYASNWHPLTWISHMIDCQIYGLKPAEHHFTNILFHSLNAMLLFLVLQQMTGATWRSCIVAAFFAWHPAHVESVAWVAERKDVLSTFFGLLCMLAYAFYAHEPRIKNSSTIYYCVALLCFAFSLLSKSMLVTLPFVLLLLDYWPLRRMQFSPSKNSENTPQKNPQLPLKSLVIEKLPMLLMVIVVCMLTIAAQQKAGSMMTATTLSLRGRVEHAFVSYCKYINMMFWPSKLAIFYPHTGAPTLKHAAIAFLIIAAISVVALQRLRDEPHFPVGWFWFLGTLLPVIGVMQAGSQAMADRYTYFPYIGLFIAIVWGAAQFWERWRAWKIALNFGVSAALVACMILTSIQLRYWRDTYTLFDRALKVTDYNFMACTVLGGELERRGKYDQAIDYLKTALTYMPNYPATHYYLGEAYLDEGRPAEAAASLKEAVRLVPNAPEAMLALARALSAEGKSDDAIQYYSAVLKLIPNSGESHYYLGLEWMKRGKYDDAVAELTEAVRLNPSMSDAQAQLVIAQRKRGGT